MHLLKAATIELEEFPPNRIPPYAILSHTWQTQEVIFDDFRHGKSSAELERTKKASWSKIQGSCKCTLNDGLEYVWIDSCCVDKSSSAELSETLNSMFAWYEKATICYAYLADVSADGDPNQPGSAFEHSKWFTRGWTLQELLAPREILFFSHDWAEIGKKSTEKNQLCSTISKITRIDEDTLMHQKPLGFSSVARRMAWAAHRETTRPEDIAYCLMGVFSINMPMLYGEGGEKAFLRLQEEIMKESDDQTIFAWVDRETSDISLRGLLATSPLKFAGCHNIFPYQDWAPRQPYSMTNRGLRIELPIIRRGVDEYVAALDCPSPPQYGDSSFLAIFLKRLSTVDEQYARTKVGTLAEVHERGPMQTIYVRQTIAIPDLGGIFRSHILQLREMRGVQYRAVKTLAPDDAKGAVALTSTRTGLAADRLPRAYKIVKGRSNHLLCCLVFERTGGPALLVMLGSEEGFAIGFDAIDAQNPEMFDNDDLEAIRQVYVPRKSGNWITLDDHSVRVDAEPRIHNSSKYYLIDVTIQPIYKPTNPIKAISDALQTPSLGIRPAIKPRKEPEKKPDPELQPPPYPGKTQKSDLEPVKTDAQPEKIKSTSRWRLAFKSNAR